MANDMQRNPQNDIAKFEQPRLPYHPAIEAKFGIDKGTWKVLAEAIYPNASTTESVVLALSYCKARGLDPLKRCVHIVPIWDSKQKKMVDTLWPGIAELRTTASRTREYAGRDETSFGPDVPFTWDNEGKEVKVTFPEYAQVTVYRFVNGQKMTFSGPRVYWLETFASTKSGAPNSMWQKRPRGQIDKCAEAAALRMAFPEEIGDQHTSDEGPSIYQHGGHGVGEVKDFRDLSLESGDRKQEASASVKAGDVFNEEQPPLKEPEGEAFLEG